MYESTVDTSDRNFFFTNALSAGGGWDSKALRILADEIAFNNQAVVVVPDISRGRVAAVGYEEGNVWDNLDPETLFDDVIATLRYTREEFSVKSLCLAGVGAGAGKALEISCDLFDAAFEPFWEKLQPLVEAMLSANFGGRNFDSHPTVKAVRELLSECDTLQRVVHFREEDFFELADPLPFAEVLQAQEDWKDWDVDSSESASSGEDDIGSGNEEVKNGMGADSVVDKEEVLAAAGLSSQDIAGLFNEIPLDSSPQSETEPTTRESITSDEVDKEIPNNLRPNQLEEWKTFCTKIQRVADLASNLSSSRRYVCVYSSILIDRDHERSFQSILFSPCPCRDSAIVSEYSSLSAVELWPLVPRAMLAITPQRFNVSFVGRRLKTPTIFALSDTEANERQGIHSFVHSSSSIILYRNRNVCIGHFELGRQQKNYILCYWPERTKF